MTVEPQAIGTIKIEPSRARATGSVLFEGDVREDLGRCPFENIHLVDAPNDLLQIDAI